MTEDGSLKSESFTEKGQLLKERTIKKVQRSQMYAGEAYSAVLHVVRHN